MRHMKTITAVLTLPLFSAIAGTVVAETAAIAAVDDNTWGWAKRASQHEANQAALQACIEGSKNKACRVRPGVRAVVGAVGANMTAVGFSYISVDDAKKQALKYCRDADCKISYVVTSPGFFAITKSEPDQEGSALYDLAYEFANPDLARESSLEKCEQRSGHKCNVEFFGVIAGHIKAAKASTAVPAQARADGNCRPRTQMIRCTSRCFNGDCTVTYENGCRIRVQVTPRFDSFQNQWVYPSPSC